MCFKYTILFIYVSPALFLSLYKKMTPTSCAGVMGKKRDWFTRDGEHILILKKKLLFFLLLQL